MEFEEQPKEQQCGNTRAQVAKLPWLPSLAKSVCSGLSKTLRRLIPSRYVATLETGPFAMGPGQEGTSGQPAGLNKGRLRCVLRECTRYV